MCNRGAPVRNDRYEPPARKNRAGPPGRTGGTNRGREGRVSPLLHDTKRAGEIHASHTACRKQRSQRHRSDAEHDDGDQRCR